MKRILFAVALSSLSLGPVFAVEDVIWDNRPAKGWENSWYPLGNGRLGCMVDGGAKTLKVQFNVDSFWTGDKNITGPVNDRNADANYRSMGAFQNFGELEISLNAPDAQPVGYKRSLDLSKAVYADGFKLGDLDVRRRIFASQPDDCIVIVIRGPEEKSLDVSLRLKGAHNEPESAAAAHA